MKDEYKILIIGMFFLAAFISASDKGFKILNNEKEKSKNDFYASVGGIETKKNISYDILNETNNKDESVKKTQKENFSDYKEDKFNNNENNKDNKDLNDFKIEAKGAYAVDSKYNKEFFLKEENTAFGAASITKLMTAIIAYENLAPDLQINISESALSEEGESGFKLNEKWGLKDLVDIMLISSSNDAARAVIDEINNLNPPEKNFAVFLMNKKAKELKMEKTLFLNGTGLDLTDSAAGAKGSPKDVAIMLKYILNNHKEMLESTKKDSITLYSSSGEARYFKNTNLALNRLEGLIGGKTGFTNLSGGNLAVVYNEENPVIIVVMGSSYYGRFNDVVSVYNYIQNNFKHIIK